MGKTKELNIDLKRAHYLFEQPLWAISKQWQVQRSTVQTTVCKYKVNGTVVSLPWSGRKQKLESPAVERKLVRMVKSQPKTIKRQVCNEWEAAGREVSVSTVTCVLEAAVQERSSCSRRGSFAAQLMFGADHMDKENTFWRKTLWSDETKRNCLATMSSHMFRGEKVRPSTPRTPYLLSSMVLVVLWCKAVLLPVDQALKKIQILQETSNHQQEDWVLGTGGCSNRMKMPNIHQKCLRNG